MNPEHMPGNEKWEFTWPAGHATPPQPGDASTARLIDIGAGEKPCVSGIFAPKENSWICLTVNDGCKGTSVSSEMGSWVSVGDWK
jgi:hypothetical protein